MSIGVRLKELLKERNMTVRELSEKSGISENTLYAIIKRNNKKLDPDIAARIVDILEVPINCLITSQEFTLSIGDRLNDVKNRDILFDHFLKLNNEGQLKAIENVELLTKIPEYQKDVDIYKEYQNIKNKINADDSLLK